MPILTKNSFKENLINHQTKFLMQYFAQILKKGKYFNVLTIPILTKKQFQRGHI